MTWRGCSSVLEGADASLSGLCMTRSASLRVAALRPPCPTAPLKWLGFRVKMAANLFRVDEARWGPSGPLLAVAPDSRSKRDLQGTRAVPAFPLATWPERRGLPGDRMSLVTGYARSAQRRRRGRCKPASAGDRADGRAPAHQSQGLRLDQERARSDHILLVRLPPTRASFGADKTAFNCPGSELAAVSVFHGAKTASLSSSAGCRRGREATKRRRPEWGRSPWPRSSPACWKPLPAQGRRDSPTPQRLFGGWQRLPHWHRGPRLGCCLATRAIR